MSKANRMPALLLGLFLALATQGVHAAPPDGDGDGAVRPAYPMSSGQPLVMHSIIFEPGKYSLEPVSYAYLDLVAESLFLQPHLKIRIEAYTDSSGDERDDLMLSWQRGLAVLNYLVMQGVDKARLDYQGYGDTRPLADNSSETGRLKNRRIEFHVVGE